MYTNVVGSKNSASYPISLSFTKVHFRLKPKIKLEQEYLGLSY